MVTVLLWRLTSVQLPGVFSSVYEGGNVRNDVWGQSPQRC